MKTVIIIPARYKSTRLPGKPLKLIMGETMIYRVWENIAKIFSKKNIYVATDDKKIMNHCKVKKINCIMTSKSCKTGTDRIAEASKKIKADIYINVQGDEPLLKSKDILKVINVAKKRPNTVLNCMTKIKDRDEYLSKNVPKVIFDKNRKLTYMSRAPIPSSKKNIFKIAYKQVCIYSFPKNSLKLFGNKNKKSFFENIEDIEILRFIENGITVEMIELNSSSISVDNHRDLKKVRKIFNNENRY